MAEEKIICQFYNLATALVHFWFCQTTILLAFYILQQLSLTLIRSESPLMSPKCKIAKVSNTKCVKPVVQSIFYSTNIFITREKAAELVNLFGIKAQSLSRCLRPLRVLPSDLIHRC